jgi:ABC-type transport system involved in multi-copper enzyme maturation permease subunit
MSVPALVGTETLRLLRGWKATIYLALTMVLAVALTIILATTNANHETPMQNMNIIWPFACLQLIFCLTIFASDAFSSEASRGTLQLYIMLPQKRLKILLSKMVLPVIFFFSGLAIFSVAFTFIPYTVGFWKLWAAMVCVDSLLFFALLFTTILISIVLKGMGATALVSSVLMLYLFIWPYQTAATFGSVNPFFVGASVMKDLWDGALDTPMPLVSACLISIWAFALAYYALSRKEVSE